MTKRLYYNQPELCAFSSTVEEVIPSSGGQTRAGVILTETAFYPTSGGQVHDTGWLQAGEERVRVSEVADMQDGRIVHYLEAPSKLPVGGTVHGQIDEDRRRDHMQQHSGQHVLSAAFIELYEMPTVSFHMGEDYCSIDLATPALNADQAAAVEKRANEIVLQNRTVHIRYVTRAEAEKLGLRKLPPADRDELRLIEVEDFDLTACGGTHVAATGSIGAILLRKTDKVRQGIRVEFVCGGRAVSTARRDYKTLSEAAGLYSAQMTDVPAQIAKSFEDIKTLRKQKDEALEELAQAMASSAVAEQSEVGGQRVVVRCLSDRDTAFAKLFAQKVTRVRPGVVALVGSMVNPAGLVFAQAAGGTMDMGALLKQVLAGVGGRGGGSRDFAQGGVPVGADIEQLLRQAEELQKSEVKMQK
jgi:alanyl-tRNA synthetase